LVLRISAKRDFRTALGIPATKSIIYRDPTAGGKRSGVEGNAARVIMKRAGAFARHGTKIICSPVAFGLVAMEAPTDLRGRQAISR